MHKKLLILENISKYYASAQSVVMGLNNISLSFSTGEFVAITGESGSGKSTLAKVIAGILSYENGEMTVGGKPTSHYSQSDWEHYRSSRISFISQSYDILPGCTVLKNVVSALILTGMDKESAHLKAEEILKQVELTEFKNRRAAKLSSGQKQRLSIARALAKPAPILIADEPTGNLDNENSAKVIALLAAAAKERLVIMITHDFAEAQALATRHITVREGVIASDVELQPAGEVPEAASKTTVPESDAAAPEIGNTPTRKPAGKKKKINLSIYTAKLQIASRPVWSSIMLFFFALTAFAMFAFLGTFVVNLDDNYTRIYDDSAFFNGSDTRIIVRKNGGAEMTQEDWDALISLKYVESLERYGYLTDVNYYYREGIDYNLHYEAVVNPHGQPTGETKTTLTLAEPELFLQTVPVFSDDSAFLKAGRLPENMYEVVAVGDEHLIGKEMPVYIRYHREWAAGPSLVINVTVVGVTDKGSHLYFDEQLGRALTYHITGGEYFFAPCYTQPLSYLKTHFLTSATFKEWVLKNMPRAYKVVDGEEVLIPAEDRYPDLVYTFENYKNSESPIELYPGDVHTSNYKYHLEVAPWYFECVVPDTAGDLAALTITDYSYATRVLEAIHKQGYLAISPYQLGSTQQDPELAAERLQTLKICLLSFAAVFVLQILVLRAMFGMEIEEFKLLANLGLRCRTAKLSVFWQILTFTVGGQFLAFLAVLLCGQLQVERIVYILKYLPAVYILIFMLIHLATSLLTNLWIQSAIGKQIYPFSLQKADLEMDDTEEVSV